jgi:hypothetical protein
MGSECGCLPVPEERIVKKWRLQPGKMFLVDLEKGRIVDDQELKEALAGARPYADWIDRIREVIVGRANRQDSIEGSQQRPQPLDHLHPLRLDESRAQIILLRYINCWVS